MPSHEEICQVLKEKDIRPSLQRVIIFEHLLMNRTHPTADEIYLGLRETDRSIAKATVYNTLALLEEKRLVRVLTMENNERRYDIGTHEHGHFICENCGRVEDFCLDLDSLETDLPSSYVVCQKDVYYRGLCGQCRP